MKTLRSIPYLGVEIEVVQGNLVQEDSEAIVNAANSSLSHGGGVAAAISSAGGPTIQQESDRYVRENGPVPTGEVAVTRGGDLPARYVIHAVGPIWKGGNAGEQELLASAVRASLRAADQLGLASISIPAISSGIFGFPKKLCARTVFRAIGGFLEASEHTSLQRIRLCNVDEKTCRVFWEVSLEEFPFE